MSRPDDRAQAILERRRGFLKGVAVAGGAATVAVAAGVIAAEPQEARPEQDAAGAGYRVTPHISAYYKTAAM
jgi:hypothetical protein